MATKTIVGAKTSSKLVSSRVAEPGVVGFDVITLIDSLFSLVQPY